MRLLILLTLIASCSAPRRAFEEQQIGKNLYVKGSPADPKSPWELWEASLDTLGQRLVKQIEHQSFFYAMAPILVHGSFDPLAVAQKDGRQELRSFARVSSGPFWWDLFTMETAATLLAKSESLRNYRQGACLGAYTEALGKGGKSPDANPGLPVATVDGAKTEYRLAKNPLPFLQEFQKNSPEEKLCERWNLAKQFFAVQAPSRCEDDERTEDHRGYKILRGSDFASEKDLEQHVRNLCTQLASAHAAQLSPYDLRSLHLFLLRNPTFQNRLLDLAEREAENINLAYRMILDEKSQRKSK